MRLDERLEPGIWRPRDDLLAVLGVVVELLRRRKDFFVGLLPPDVFSGGPGEAGWILHGLRVAERHSAGCAPRCDR